MKKRRTIAILIISVCCLILGAILVLSLPGQQPARQTPKIAFFMSDPDSVFQQAQFAEAKRYAKEAYGADVMAFDGDQDEAYLLKSLDQIQTQGFDRVSLDLKASDLLAGRVGQLIGQGLFFNSYRQAFAETGIPVINSSDSDASFEMGKQMATQWLAAQPDKPIVMVEFGFADNGSDKTKRNAFVQGVQSIAPDAVDLGCLDISKGSDAAKLLMLDLCERRPEVNLIFCENYDATSSIMTALEQAGRGTFAAGQPQTEIVSCVCGDPEQIEQIYDPNSSLKLALGLSAVDLARLRIDNLFAIQNGSVRQTTTPAVVLTVPAYCISYWTVTKTDTEAWVDANFGSAEP